MSQRTCLCSVSPLFSMLSASSGQAFYLMIPGWPQVNENRYVHDHIQGEGLATFSEILSSEQRTIMTTHLQKTHSPISLCWEELLVHLRINQGSQVIRSYYHCRLHPGPGQGCWGGGQRSREGGGGGDEKGGRGLASPRLTGLRERKWKHLDEAPIKAATCPPLSSTLSLSIYPSIHPLILVVYMKNTTCKIYR